MAIATSPALPERVPVIGQDAPVERIQIDGFGQRREHIAEPHSPDSVVLEDRPWDDMEEAVLARILQGTAGKTNRWARVKKDWDRRREEGEELHPRAMEDLRERARRIREMLMEAVPETAKAISWLQDV